MPPIDLDEYHYSWKDSDNNHYDLEKIDHIWRVLKYGERDEFFDGYYHISYEDSHLVLSTRGDLHIVGAYTAETLPNITYDYTITDHAVKKIKDRSISEDELEKALDNYIYYDREGRYKWKLMSMIDGHRIFVIASCDNETIITVWRD